METEMEAGFMQGFIWILAQHRPSSAANPISDR